MTPRRRDPGTGLGGILLALAIVVGVALLLWLTGLWGAGPRP